MVIVTTPQGFIPAQDRGYVIISAQLPGAASLARTTDIVRQIEKTALDTPGIIRVAAFAGFRVRPERRRAMRRPSSPCSKSRRSA